jgi:hypothetical protein
MMEAAGTSETLVNFYQTIRRYIPEDSDLRTNRRENSNPTMSIEFMLQIVKEKTQFPYVTDRICVISCKCLTTWRCARSRW